MKPKDSSSKMAAALWPIYCLLTFLTCAVYFEVVNHEFTGWDDPVNVFENPHYQPVTTRRTLFFWTNRYNGTYRPVVHTLWAALAANAQLDAPRVIPGGGSSDIAPKTSSLSPRIFHTANLVLHIANTLMVFGLLNLLLSRRWPAFWGAAVFSLHPVQVESVAWITGINDLMTFFCLPALWFYLRSITHLSKPSRVFQYLLASLFFILALLTKPSAVTLPGVAWILAVYVLKTPGRQSSLRLSAWIMIALACALWTQEFPGKPLEAPLWARPMIALDALTFHIYHLLAPLKLAVDYGRTPQFVMASLWNFTWLAPLPIFGLLWWKRRLFPFLAAGFLIFLVSLLPVSGLVPFRFQQFSTVADRYLYFPLMGVALMVAWGASRLLETATTARIRQWGMAASLLLFALGGLSAFQVLTWTNSYTLWSNCLKVNPQSVVAHEKLGFYLAQEGALDQAEFHLHQASVINPNHVLGHLNLGTLRRRRGKIAEAASSFHQATLLEPDNAVAQTSLGFASLELGNLNAASQAFRQVQQSAPDFLPGHYGLGVTLATQGKAAQAAPHFKQAIRINPNDGMSHSKLADELRKMRKGSEAIAHYREAIRLWTQTPPNSPGPNDSTPPDPKTLAETHRHLGTLLAHRGEKELGMSHLREAARIKSTL